MKNRRKKSSQTQAQAGAEPENFFWWATKINTYNVKANYGSHIVKAIFFLANRTTTV